MIDFAVIALPKSATSWAANWLTTDESVCVHDPMVWHTPDEMADLRAINSAQSKYRGVACTGLWMVPGWVEQNVSRWVIVERPIEEVNAGLAAMGLGPMPEHCVRQFAKMPGERISMGALFEEATAHAVWNKLLPHVPFDRERHKLLTELMVTPAFQRIEPDPIAVKAWLKRIAEAAK